MRNLNIEEIENRIQDYAFDIEHVEKRHLSLKVITFLTFLIVNRYQVEYFSVFPKIIVNYKKRLSEFEKIKKQS